MTERPSSPRSIRPSLGLGVTAIYDANVLFPAPLRDLLIRVGMTGVVRARWTDRILDECFASLAAHRPDLSVARLERTRERMAHHSIRDVLITGYEHLIDGLVLPDPDDRHILAAAIHVGAQAIVTRNLRDFPASVLEPMGVLAVHPDAFVMELIEAAPDSIVEVVIAQARALRNPATSVSELLATLAGQGLEDSVTKLFGLLGVPSRTVSG